MPEKKCLYCGNQFLEELDSPSKTSQNCRIWQCQKCQVMFSELEQRFELGTTPLSYLPKFDVCSEDAVLHEALQLMKKSEWNSALELLFLPSSPLKHPLEFLFFRDVCQAGAVILHDCILDIDWNYEHRQACEQMFLMMDNNLGVLDYYLASMSDGERLSALQYLSEAICCFADAPINVLKLPSSQQVALADFIIEKRALVLNGFANYLESCQGQSNGGVYLYMAVDVWHKALGCKDSGKFYVVGGVKHKDFFQLSDKLTIAIKQNIHDVIDSPEWPAITAALRPAVAHADKSDLTANKGVYYYSVRRELSFCCLFAISSVAAIGGIAFLVNNDTAYRFVCKNLPTDANGVLLFVLLPLFCLLYGIALPYSLFGSKARRKRKKMQLYKRLFKA
ncbi:MAG: hypothetical protein Q4F00_10030 [bacterium]|nr:hypothetical protein [bacterium]